jgi:TPR repeat protein
LCYEDGDGVEKNAKKAFDLFQAASEQGLPSAQCNVGFRLDRDGDKKGALRYYELAASKNNSAALCNLGVYRETVCSIALRCACGC